LDAFARQKLESLGTLASGIAHDFNNVLGAIAAQAELGTAELASGANAREQLGAIKEIALRGSDIVRQLMIYAGKESDVLELVDVSKTVEDMLGLLRSTIPTRALLRSDLGEQLPAVKARTAQIRQVLMNLVVNASEAVKDREGVIQVTTKCITVGPNTTGLPLEVSEGDYIQLEVSDNGCGISPDVQARIFDPFFSTKSAGRGLGLPVIHGILRNLSGAIRMESEVGRGTTVQVLLPSAGTMPPPARDTVPANEQELYRSSPEATVLVVEDENLLRAAVKKILSKAGFAVLEAADGSEAIRLLQATDVKIDILFLDMTIPGSSSYEVLTEAVRAWPQMKVVLTSAFSEEMTKGNLSAPQVRAFVRKPFRLAAVVSILRNALSS
jgi:CheY-like chemotaxis protein